MTNPANPAHSTFTVTVKFRDVLYDVGITPTMNGVPIENLPLNRIAHWKGAEQSHQVYSRTIAELLVHSKTLSDKLAALAADGSLTVAGSDEEFTFPDTSVKHDEKVKEVWGRFVSYLDDPVSGMNELAPLETDNKAASTETNGYLTLNPEEQKAVRKGLLEKNYRLFARRKTTIEPKNYTDVEKCCIAQILKKSKKEKSKTDNLLNGLTLALWNKLESDEKDELSGSLERIEAEEEALQALKDADSDPDAFSFDSDLSTSNEEI